MKTNTKKMIRLAAVLYCVLLVVVLISTLAWFVLDKTAGIASEDEMKITVGEGLEISLDGTSWGQLQKPTVSQNCPDITGDGVNFYYPQTLDENDENPSSFLNINTHAERNKFYIDVVVHFRTNGSSAVYLQQTSTVKGVNMDLTDDMSGSVPKDAIAGAVRVAFYDITSVVGTTRGDAAVKTLIDDMSDDQYKTALQYIWIPNDKYQITEKTETEKNDAGVGVDVTKLTFSDNGTREEVYGYLAPDGTGEYTQTNWTEDDYSSGKVVVGNEGFATATSTANATYLAINSVNPLLDFSDDTTEGMKEKTLLIRIWVEGTDREAHTYLNSGEVQYKFDFISIDKLATTAEDNTKLEGITANGSTLTYADGTEVKDGEILYSENGIDWSNYTPSIRNNGGFKSSTIYIKLAETAEKRPSEVRTLTVTAAASSS